MNPQRRLPMLLVSLFLAGLTLTVATPAATTNSTATSKSTAGTGARSQTPKSSAAQPTAQPGTASSRAAFEPKDPSDRRQQKREAVDEMANMTMHRLLSESPQAKRLFDRSVGYAVFDNFKVALLVSGGGGIGVAVERSSLAHTYMKMGTGGLGLGLGGHSYNVVFLFEDLEAYRNFVDNGWHASTSASAAMWSRGASAEANFSHGLAVYQLTNKGVIADVDFCGTRYWKHKKLNAQ